MQSFASSHVVPPEPTEIKRVVRSRLASAGMVVEKRFYCCALWAREFVELGGGALRLRLSSVRRRVGDDTPLMRVTCKIWDMSDRDVGPGRGGECEDISQSVFPGLLRVNIKERGF